MKIMYNAGRETKFCSSLLFFYQFSCLFFFRFLSTVCVTKMKLLSNFATLRYVFFFFAFSIFGFIFFTCVRMYTLELNLKLYYFGYGHAPSTPTLPLVGRRSHSDTVYGFDMALFMQLPQLFMQLQIDFAKYFCEFKQDSSST